MAITSIFNQGPFDPLVDFKGDSQGDLPRFMYVLFLWSNLFNFADLKKFDPTADKYPL